MKSIVMIIGSHRNKNSNSSYIADELGSLLSHKFTIQKLSVLSKLNVAKAESIFKADCIIFLSPIYFDILPSQMLYFIEELEKMAKKHVLSGKARVYAISNCGFFEGEHNEVALEIYNTFCSSIGFRWRFGVGIGCGELLYSTKTFIPMASFFKRPIFDSLQYLADDMISVCIERKENIFSRARINKRCYSLICNIFWSLSGRKNHLRGKHLLSYPDDDQMRKLRLNYGVSGSCGSG